MSPGSRIDEERRQLFVSAGVKVLGVAVAIGLAIGLGTYVVVKSLGLDETDTGALGQVHVDPVTPLPTTALPVPTDLPTPSGEPSGLITNTPTGGATGGLTLSASPVFVKPGERINLTGTWPGHDAMGLLVQRKLGADWSDFGVQTQVSVGTYDTWVITNRTGDQIFRVYDPASKTASNEVKVTVQ
ncbi:MAG: hypothetical protein J7518_10700 [Nocardioidaceae bacterium]|nr:hypothetical protein [Nocardioidaceae bacterium]